MSVLVRKNRWTWLTWWFNHLPGPSISPKRTPMFGRVSLLRAACLNPGSQPEWIVPMCRPCCPANVFFSNPVAPQEEDPPCVQRLSPKELSRVRRFFDRGHPIFAASLQIHTPKAPRRGLRSGFNLAYAPLSWEGLGGVNLGDQHAAPCFASNVSSARLTELTCSKHGV